MGKISKTGPRDLMLIYDELSEFGIFVSSLILSVVKSVSFT